MNRLESCIMNRRNIFLVVSVIVFATSCASALAIETFKIDPAHSRIGFKVRQALATVAGRFKQFGGTIELDREHPERSSVMATIQVKSIDTGIAKRDAHLRSPEFFNVAKFPEITFKSRSVKQTSSDAGNIIGDFTMHGVTRSRTLHVKLLTKTGEPKTRWQVTTEPLSRREFGLQFSKTLESVSMISDTVAVNMEIEATKAQ